LSTTPSHDDPDTWPTRREPTLHRAPVRDEETVVQQAPPPVPPEDVPSERNLGWGMLLALGVIALVAIGAIVAWLLTHRDHTRNTTTVVVTQPGATTPGATNPGGKKIRPGTPMLVPVPAVTGQQQAAAEQALRGLGFQVSTTTVPSTQPKGTVVAQHPAASANARHGSAVRINVAAGPSTTTPGATTTQPATTTAPAQPATASVPDVTNNPLQPAVQQLATAGFRISLQYVPSTDPLGTVVAQSPQGSATAPTGSHVTVNAASGPGDKPQETVPTLTGGSLPHAVSTANGAHLRLIYVKRTVTDKTQAGTVVDQSPAAGAHAPQNAQVLAYLGAYRGP
jgi:beta-lactam-binding protein with PASTA domain